MDRSSASSSKADRKTIEKNRREEMKALFTKLKSLVPHGSNSRESGSLSDQIEVAGKYIKELEAQLEKLKEKKKKLLSCHGFQSKSPRVEVCVRGNSVIEVLLITGLDCYTIFKEAIRILNDEGIEIVNACFSIVDDTSISHTFHGKIEEIAMGQGLVERITERLKLMMLSVDG